ncbi:MAG: carbon-nitrogen hydrolase family protein [Anaerolineae bacterium]|nr:carbon-nitrogen hydrolase family protein [Anaerolineae bacterium]
MSRTIKVAAIQMSAEPGLVTERLARTEVLIARAAKAGAQLAVLPEMFNTGYAYSDSIYSHAEPADGLTARWMKSVAARHHIHIAGSLLLLGEEDIYNTMLLVAPDGHEWRYDKNYPWMWERAYFRENSSITVADTSLGQLGMMVCWDMAHPDLWDRYGGKVDMMLISSCPPNFRDAAITLPGGVRLKVDEINPLLRFLLRLGQDAFGEKLRYQSSRMRVPVAAATGTGTFSSSVPMPRLSFSLLVLASPALWRYLPQAAESRIEGGFCQETYVADAGGKVLDQVAAGSESYALAEIRLADAPPQPTGRQPEFGLTPLPYLLDALFNTVATPIYRRKVRTYYGSRMAPVRPATRRQTGLLLAMLGIGFLLGRLFAPRRVKKVKVIAPAEEKRPAEIPPDQSLGKAAAESKQKPTKRLELARLLLSVALHVSKLMLEHKNKGKKKKRSAKAGAAK